MAEFELALRRDAVLEGGNLLFPQDSIRLLFRDAQFDDDLPNAWARIRARLQRSEHICIVEPLTFLSSTQSTRELRHSNVLEQPGPVYAQEKDHHFERILPA